jgi:NAD(P)-dependent dehydrogenase (short-subunit alcohol dehydrogenase family)
MLVWRIDPPSRTDFGKALGLSIALADKQLIRRAGLPEDIAKAALWLASDGGIARTSPD